MTQGLRSRELSDALTRRQLNVERTKTGLQREYDEVSGAVTAALIVALGSVNGTKFGQITKTELRRVVLAVLKAYDTAAVKYTDRLTAWLKKYVDNESRFMGNAMNQAVDEDIPVPAVWPFVAATIIGATGATPLDSLKDMRSTQRKAVERYIKKAYVQRWSVSQVITGFKGTRLRNFKDGLISKLKRGATSTVDTVIQAGMSASRIKVMQKYMDWTLGYTWVSVLDGRTSKVCRSLSGRVFKYGAGPTPPMHLNCRSHIEPIFKKSAIRRGTGMAVSTGETYYEWMSRQTKAFQEETLGSSWARIFREGGLSATEFADKVLNRRYQPMTLDALKASDPDLFN